MGTLVAYQLEDSIATITMDDGKVNVMSLPMIAGRPRAGVMAPHPLLRRT
jgi:hypothetical protein